MYLETQRLIIRKLKDSDLEAFTAYRSDPEVCRWQSFEPFTLTDSRKFIAEHQNEPQDDLRKAGQWMQLGLALKENDLLLGDIGLKPERHEPRMAEFGITLSPVYQKRGFAREALTEVFRHLFYKLDIHRVTGITDIENAASIALLESLHFRREAHFRKSFFGNDGWRDEYLYALLKDEFTG